MTFVAVCVFLYLWSIIDCNVPPQPILRDGIWYENNILQCDADNSISIIKTASVAEHFPLCVRGSSFCQEARDIESEGVTFSVCACVFQVGHSFMRVSLTLKPNSRSDFGFQTHWDSTGATVQFIQPGETFHFKDGGFGVVFFGGEVLNLLPLEV